MSDERVAPIPLFRGLDPAVVQELIDSLPTRSFAPGEYLCQEGQPGSSLFIIQRGLAQVTVGAGVNVGRLRRGDVIGEMSMLTGEARTASVVATVDTVALELDQMTFAVTLSRHPELLANLTRILSERLARTTQSRSESSGRGEAVTLVVGAGLDAVADAVVAMVARTSPGATSVVELRGEAASSDDRLEQTVAALDERLAVNATVTIVAPASFPDLPILAAQTDRTVVLARSEEAAAIVAGLGESVLVEIALVDGADSVTTVGRASVVRLVSSQGDAAAVGWLGRHISRTKLGVALGAGGAKGYAHVGAIRVLEEAGYTIDYVSGSSIGAIVGVCLGLGKNSYEVERTLRGIFTPEHVDAMFQLSFAGTSAGAEIMRAALGELTGDRTFADLVIPVTAMTVDLDAKTAQPIDSGPLRDALGAATALAGFVPPYVRGDQRLIDAVAMVPVPSDAVRSSGADVTVSVNIMSRRSLPAWPGQSAPEATKKRERMLDVLLQVMDLAQIDSSVRHAARADVVLTPAFGPATWREFDLADLFLAAGREVALEQLPALQALARPPTLDG